MTGNNKRIGVFALAILGAAVSIAGIGGASYAHSEAEAASSQSYCEVLAHKNNGSYALEAVFNADADITGTYQFSVRSVGGAGQTNINQGGGFTANANESVVLGKMNLGGSSAYDVSLTVTAGGVSHECGGRLGD